MKRDYNLKAKKLITSGHLTSFKTVKEYNGFSPALLLHFDNHSPIAIAKEKWQEYSELILSTLDPF